MTHTVTLAQIGPETPKRRRRRPRAGNRVLSYIGGAVALATVVAIIALHFWPGFDPYAQDLTAVRPVSYTHLDVYKRQVATIGIVSEADYEAKGPEAFPDAPVGTGPYEFVAWNHGVDYRVKKFDGYWGEAGKLDEVTFSFVGAADARVTGVESASLDAALIPASQVPVLDGSANAAVVEAASNKVALIGVNTTAGALQNAQLRQAIPLLSLIHI